MKCYITNIQNPNGSYGYGVGLTWVDAVADALKIDSRAFVGSDGRVYIDVPVNL